MFAISKLASASATALTSRMSSSLLRMNYSTTNPSFLAAMQTGSVKWFDIKKGFGFIVPDDGSPDIFVHQSVIHSEGFRSLAEGEPVEFSVEKDNNGRIKADRVTGPLGAFVQGAPRRPFRERVGGLGGNSGFGGSRGGYDRNNNNDDDYNDNDSSNYDNNNHDKNEPKY